MVVTDTFLEEMAKALSSESYTTPTYLAVGTMIITPSTSATDLDGEIGSRESLTNSRENNSVEFSAVRSSTAVVQSTGDTLNSTGLFSASTGGNLFTNVSLPSLNHTTSFDIDFDWTFTIDRV